MILNKKEIYVVISWVTPAFCFKVHSRQQFREMESKPTQWYCWAEEAEFWAQSTEVAGNWRKGGYCTESALKCAEMQDEIT